MSGTFHKGIKPTADFYKGIKPVDNIDLSAQDADAARKLVDQLAKIKAHIAELENEADDVAEALRSIVGGNTGRVQGSNGYSVTVAENRRFVASRAKTAFKKNPQVLAAISTPTPNAAAARKALADKRITPEQFDQMMSNGAAVLRINAPTESTEDE